MSELFADVADFEAIDDREYAEVETGWSKDKKVRLRSLTAEEFAKCDEFVFEQETETCKSQSMPARSNDR